MNAQQTKEARYDGAHEKRTSLSSLDLVGLVQLIKGIVQLIRSFGCGLGGQFNEPTQELRHAGALVCDDDHDIRHVMTYKLDSCTLLLLRLRILAIKG